jgi:hypothetical protein
MIGPEVRQLRDEKMGHENGRSAQRHATDQRRVGRLRQPGDAVSASFHFPGSLQHLLAGSREAAGSRQAIDKPNIKCGLECG